MLAMYFLEKVWHLCQFPQTICVCKAIFTCCLELLSTTLEKKKKKRILELEPPGVSEKMAFNERLIRKERGVNILTYFKFGGRNLVTGSEATLNLNKEQSIVRR